MKQVFGTRFPAVWLLALGLAWAGCTQAGGGEKAGNESAATGTAGETPGRTGAVDTATDSGLEKPPAAEPTATGSEDKAAFDKEAAMAEARRREQQPPPPAVTKAPGSDAPAVDTSRLTPAPAWTARNLQGATVTNADFAGKVVILDFWATWCGPCKREIPHFMELYAQYGAQGLEVVGVDVGEPASKVAPFVQQMGINYPMVLGTQQMVSDYGPINGIPTTFIITPDGKIYRRYVGYRPKATFEQDVRTLLGITS